jgi:hypothetical protein
MQRAEKGKKHAQFSKVETRGFGWLGQGRQEGGTEQTSGTLVPNQQPNVACCTPQRANHARPEFVTSMNAPEFDHAFPYALVF